MNSLSCLFLHNHDNITTEKSRKSGLFPILIECIQDISLFVFLCADISGHMNNFERKCVMRMLVPPEITLIISLVPPPNLGGKN